MRISAVQRRRSARCSNRAILLAVLSLTGMQGCEYGSSVKHYGVFTIEAHYAGTRLVSGIRQTHAKLCVEGNDKCREAFSFSFSVAENSMRSIVAIKERRDGPSDRVRVGFYNATSGHQLPCWNCSYDVGARIDLGSYFQWSNSDEYGALFHRNLSAAGSRTLVILKFHQYGYEIIQLGEWPAFITTYASFRPDSRAFAWYLCNPLCNLHWYDIDTAEFHMTPTICPDHYLVYEWVGEIPEPRLHWGAILPRNICYNSQGEPAYPYQIKPGCEPPSTLSSLECQPPKPLETDRDGRVIR